MQVTDGEGDFFNIILLNFLEGNWEFRNFAPLTNDNKQSRFLHSYSDLNF